MYGYGLPILKFTEKITKQSVYYFLVNVIET